MNYLLLVYVNQQTLAGLSASEQQHRTEAGRLTDDLLRASGRLLAGAQLPTVTEVTTVTFQGTQLTLTAGALGEGALHLGAFYYITAGDLNEAIQVATQLPQLHSGAVEVHPLSG